MKGSALSPAIQFLVNNNPYHGTSVVVLLNGGTSGMLAAHQNGFLSERASVFAGVVTTLGTMTSSYETDEGLLISQEVQQFEAAYRHGHQIASKMFRAEQAPPVVSTDSDNITHIRSGQRQIAFPKRTPGINEALHRTIGVIREHQPWIDGMLHIYFQREPGGSIGPWRERHPIFENAKELFTIQDPLKRHLLPAAQEIADNALLPRDIQKISAFQLFNLILEIPAFLFGTQEYLDQLEQGLRQADALSRSAYTAIELWRAFLEPIEES